MMEDDKVVETKDVIMQIKEARNRIDKKKAGGYNKKNVKNINDIIKSDKKVQVKHGKAAVHDRKREAVTRKIRGEQHDATPALPPLPAGPVVRSEDDTAAVVGEQGTVAMDNENMAERQESINEKEQQALMNRVFDSPSMYTAAEQFTTSSSNTSSPPLSSSSSYSCSSASSDAGFEDGEMSEDGGSLAGDMEDTEDKLTLSEDEDRHFPQDKDRLEEEGSEEAFTILDE